MNLKEIEYILRIADEKSLTSAAGSLFITPSALNQQLLRLEREIGTPLFNRTRSGWTPTRAGQIYIDAAREIVKIKQRTYARLQDVVDEHRGTLTIGLTPRRIESTFNHVYPRFHEKYPNITLNVLEGSVRRQQRMIANGELDIGFVSLEENQHTDDDYYPISTEEVLLFVSSTHPLLKYARPTEDQYPEIDLALFKDESFALIYPESTLRDTINRLFTNAGFSPRVLIESSYMRNFMKMVESGVCCTIGTVNTCWKPQQGVTICRFPERPKVRLEYCVRKGNHLSEPGMDLISMITEYWSQADHEL